MTCQLLNHCEELIQTNAKSLSEHLTKLNILQPCKSLRQTNARSLSEHLTKLNNLVNNIQPCKPLRRTNAKTAADHIYRLNHKRYDYVEDLDDCYTLLDKFYNFFNMCY